MLSRLPGPLVALISTTLYILNLIICSASVLICAIPMLFVNQKQREKIRQFLHIFPETWIDVNQFITRITCKTQWDIRGTEHLKYEDWYLTISNHQSWVDILVLQEALNKKIPMLKFFMKKSLKWQFLIGAQIAQIFNFPFMHRYSSDYLKKHPEKRGLDLKTTKEFCQKFLDIPTSIAVFPEGKRFSKKRHEQQNSPFQYLLKPKAGGVAFVLSTMEGILKNILNVTIIYSEGDNTLYRFLSGRIRKVTIDIQHIKITPELVGNYENDREFRVRFQAWLNQLWLEKDKLIGQVKAEDRKNNE